MKEITTNKNILNENSDILKKYFKDISKYKLISGEEQVELARKAKEGDKKSREKLINSNLRFVVTCAKQYTGQGVPLMDLINAGNYGLILAIENFDPDRGYKFLSFAVWYIRREIIRELYNTGRTIRYPITYICKVSKVKKAYDNFVKEYNRDPTEEELINLTNLTQKQYNSVVMNKSSCVSLDTPVTEDEKTTLEEILSNDIIPFSDVFTSDTINKCLKVLNAREYKVISEYYGLNGRAERTIKEISKEIGLGEERIRQIRKGAIKKLKHKKGKTLETLL